MTASFPTMRDAAWLAMDAGNSAVKAGLFADGELLQVWTFSDDPSAWPEELTARLDGRPISRAGLVSVVPETTPLLQDTLRQVANIDLEVIDVNSALPIELAYETPDTLGTDRLAAAVGGWVHYGAAGRDVLVIDAGTAVTYEVISGAGVFQGGAIGAGPALLHRALHEGTAQLPEVPPDLPETPVGRSTREALQSGVLHGFLDSVRGMVERVTQALGQPPTVVVTGGWHALLRRHLACIDHADPHLVLRGVHAIMKEEDPS